MRSTELWFLPGYAKNNRTLTIFSSLSKHNSSKVYKFLEDVAGSCVMPKPKEAFALAKQQYKKHQTSWGIIMLTCKVSLTWRSALVNN